MSSYLPKTPSVNAIMLDISFQHMNFEGTDFEALSGKSCHSFRVRDSKESQAKAVGIETGVQEPGSRMPPVCRREANLSCRR